MHDGYCWRYRNEDSIQRKGVTQRLKQMERGRVLLELLSPLRHGATVQEVQHDVEIVLGARYVAANRPATPGTAERKEKLEKNRLKTFQFVSLKESFNDDHSKNF